MQQLGFLLVALSGASVLSVSPVEHKKAFNIVAILCQSYMCKRCTDESSSSNLGYFHPTCLKTLQTEKENLPMTIRDQSDTSGGQQM